MRPFSKTLIAAAGLTAVLGAASAASAHEGWRHHHRHHHHDHHRRFEAGQRFESRDHRDGDARVDSHAAPGDHR